MRILQMYIRVSPRNSPIKSIDVIKSWDLRKLGLPESSVYIESIFSSYEYESQIS